jgi:hypothetical protein
VAIGLRKTYLPAITAGAGAARGAAMGKLGSKIGTIALVAALLGLLAGSMWFAVHTWMSVEGPPMPTTGYVAMTLGVVFSIVVGSGLMGLIFYSSRHGYDEPSYEESRHGEPRQANNDGPRTGGPAAR